MGTALIQSLQTKILLAIAAALLILAGEVTYRQNQRAKREQERVQLNKDMDRYAHEDGIGQNKLIESLTRKK